VAGRVRRSTSPITTSANKKKASDNDKKNTNNKTSRKTPKRKSSGAEKYSDSPSRTKKKQKKQEIEEVTSLSGAEHVRRRVRVNFTMSDGSHAWYDGVIADHNAVDNDDNDNDDNDDGQSPRSTYHVHFEDGDQIWMQLFTGGYEFI
jgi:hypothetical protein